jgi:hypothetical protein
MTLSAVQSLEDAVAATRAFLWPVDRRRWIRLVLVTFFVGGVGGFNPLSFGQSTGGANTPPVSDTPGVPTSGGLPSVGGAELAVVAAVLIVLALGVLGFLFVGSVMEFVFVESLRRETVRIRRYWRVRWRQGLRLFGFRALVGVVTFGTVAVLGAVVLVPGVLGGTPLLSVGLLVVFVPLFVLLVLVVGVVNGFTTMFVVPVMISEDRRVLSGWRRFWPTLRGNVTEYAVYAVAAFVLQLAGGILVGLLTLLGALGLAIPFGLLALLGVGLLTVVEAAGFVVIVVAVGLFGLSAVVLAATVAMPVKTFLRFYALFVLGATNEAFDLVPERRDAPEEAESA